MSILWVSFKISGANQRKVFVSEWKCHIHTHTIKESGKKRIKVLYYKYIRACQHWFKRQCVHYYEFCLSKQKKKYFYILWNLVFLSLSPALCIRCIVGIAFPMVYIYMFQFPKCVMCIFAAFFLFIFYLITFTVFHARR